MNPAAAVLALLSALFAAPGLVRADGAPPLPSPPANYGKRIIPAGQWLGGKGVDVFANGTPFYYSGDLSAPAVGVKWQCVELPQRLYQSLGWHTGMFPVAVATQIYTKAAAFGMTTHPNGGGCAPVPGDMVVMTGGGTFDGSPIGHVAVVDRVDDCGVFLVEQNWSGTGRAVLSRTGPDGSFLSARGGYTVLGIVHSPHDALPPTPTAVPQIGTTADERLIVLMRGRDGVVYACAQRAPGGAWGQWVRLGGSVAGNPVVVRDGQGRLEFLARGADGVLHGRRQVKSGGWAAWERLGLGVGSDPDGAVGPDGRLVATARGTDGALYAASRGAGPWASWVRVSGTAAGAAASEPAAGRDESGHLALFVRNADGAVAGAWRAAGAPWAAWRSEGGHVMGRPVFGLGRDGGLALFVLGTDGLVYQKSRQAAVWSDWKGLPAAAVPGENDPALAVNAGGARQLFLRGVDDAVYTTRQEPSGDWNAWASLGGKAATRPAAVRDAGGRLHLFFLGTDGLVYSRRQAAPNAPSWSAPFPLGDRIPRF